MHTISTTLLTLAALLKPSFSLPAAAPAWPWCDPLRDPSCISEGPPPGWTPPSHDPISPTQTGMYAAPNQVGYEPAPWPTGVSDTVRRSPQDLGEPGYDNAGDNPPPPPPPPAPAPAYAPGWCTFHFTRHQKQEPTTENGNTYIPYRKFASLFQFNR